jgi:hypothetical protein
MLATHKSKKSASFKRPHLSAVSKKQYFQVKKYELR